MAEGVKEGPKEVKIMAKRNLKLPKRGKKD